MSGPVVHLGVCLWKATGQSKVLKSVVRPDGWDDERLKLEVRLLVRSWIAFQRQKTFAGALEARILQNLDHPHILRIFSWYEESDSINIAQTLDNITALWMFCVPEPGE